MEQASIRSISDLHTNCFLIGANFLREFRDHGAEASSVAHLFLGPVMCLAASCILRWAAKNQPQQEETGQGSFDCCEIG